MRENTRDFIILKFGGTSLSSKKKWATISQVIKQKNTVTTRPIVVCSALSQVSNQLEKLITKALTGDHLPIIERLKTQHNELLESLKADSAKPQLEDLFANIVKLCHGISLIGSAPPSLKARIMAFGEILSTTEFASVK